MRVRGIHIGRRRAAAVAGALLLICGAGVFALLEGDIPEALRDVARPFAYVLRSYGHLAPIPLLYIEESGVPLPLPGDVFVMYVAHHIPHTPLALGLAWAGLVTAVVLGATNLFWLSRRIGTGLPEHRLGRLLHVTPARVERARAWFGRYGPAALIVGRHIPGFRVPLTVAAGIAGVSYRTFIVSVAISTGTWVAVFLYLGVVFGGRIGHLIELHRRTTFLLVGGFVVLVLLGAGALRLRRGRLGNSAGH
ncbi:MAG: hypothetical protein QOK05_1679 [Chloroflexota bacterium]|nr:hypothetical protein [Chloroflexota bacterium]